MSDFYSWQKGDKKFSDVLTSDSPNQDFDYLSSFSQKQEQNSIFEQLQNSYNNRQHGHAFDGFQTDGTQQINTIPSSHDHTTNYNAQNTYAFEAVSAVSNISVNGQVLDDYGEDYAQDDEYFDLEEQENRLRNLEGKPNNLLNDLSNGAKKVVLVQYSLINRLIWLVSTAIMIGSVIFYFIAVQPSAFNLLHSVVVGKIDKIQKSHTDILATARDFRTDMDKTITSYPVATNCSLQQPIDYSSFNTERFDSLIKNDIQPDSELLNLYANESFKYSFFANTYVDLYNNYQQNVLAIGQTVENYSYLPALLEYQNVYVESCKQLVNGQFRSDIIAKQCDLLQTKANATLKRFVDLEIPPTSRVSTAVNKSIQDCGVQPTGRGATLTSNIVNWRDSYYLSYQDFMDRKINFAPFDEAVKRIETDFTENLDTVRSSINKEYQNKQKGFPNIYILQPNLNSKTFKLPFFSK